MFLVGSVEMTSQILQNENALLKNQIKLLNEKVDSISTKNTETINTCSQMIQLERMLNTINESVSESIIKTPKNRKTKHKTKHKTKTKTKTKTNLYDLLTKIHN